MSPKTTPRDSSLELYRILVMLLIIAHHSVVNSGLKAAIESAPITANGLFLLMLGGWGKIGINCFVTWNFVSAYLVFFLLIPFLNVVVKGISRRQHEILLGISLLFLSVLPCILFEWCWVFAFGSSIVVFGCCSVVEMLRMQVAELCHVRKVSNVERTDS